MYTHTDLQQILLACWMHCNISTQLNDTASTSGCSNTNRDEIVADRTALGDLEEHCLHFGHDQTYPGRRAIRDPI